jgi:hypothetical protein
MYTCCYPRLLCLVDVYDIVFKYEINRRYKVSLEKAVERCLQMSTDNIHVRSQSPVQTDSKL